MYMQEEQWKGKTINRPTTCEYANDACKTEKLSFITEENKVESVS